MNKQINTHGLIPSPKDGRDFLLSSVMPEIKRFPETCPPPFDLTILNQRQHPACVGFACSAIKQEKELREKTPRVFDGLWIYGEAKKIDGMPNVPGTFFRVGLKVLKNIGAKVLDKDEDPSMYRIAEYRQVDDMSFGGLKKAIFLYGAILAGFRMSNEGWRKEVVKPPKAGETIYGHAVAVIGYEKDYLIGQNSWGEKFHEKGLFKIPKDYLPFEAWCVVLDKVNEAQEEVKTGWVARNWLSAQNIITASLNVRAGAGLGYPILKTLPQGTKVKLYGSANVSANGFWWTQILI
jgi:hypothetical protein